MPEDSSENISPKNILVIKLSALGDFIQALGPMKAIRDHHPGARITLLTTPAYQKLGQDCGYFDSVLIDPRPGKLNLFQWLHLRKFFNQVGFDRVYDLQKKDRTQLYYNLFKPKPEWVGIAKGASHRNTDPAHFQGRAFEGHAGTLALAGIKGVTPDNLEWMKADISCFDLPARYILMIPGASAMHPEKRWPAENVAGLTGSVIDKEITPVFIGSQEDQGFIKQIFKILNQHNYADQAMNLCGKTGLYDIAALARGSLGVIGNDTGPMHIAAVTGAPSLVLFNTKSSDPGKHLPLGPQVRSLSAKDPALITPEQVLKEIEKMIRPAKPDSAPEKSESIKGGQGF